MADGEYVAVLDRVEAGEAERLAVLLLERGDRQVGELVVPAADLPAEAGQGAVLHVTVADDELTDATYLPSETAERSAAAQRRFDALARRPPASGEEDAPEPAANSYPADERSDDSMVHAYLMVSTSAGSSEGVLSALQSVDAVTEAHVVAGEWDLVVELDGETVTDVLHAVTTGVRSLDGVGTTRCYVCLD